MLWMSPPNLDLSGESHEPVEVVMNWIMMWFIFLSSFLPLQGQERVTGHELVNQLYMEHVDWFRTNFDADYPVHWSYHLSNFNRAAPDVSMMNVYLDVQECARAWPAYAKDFEDTPFRDVRWYLFDEGWSLNTQTHVGAQIRGIVFAAKHISLERASVSKSHTVVHEIMHVFFPNLWHNVEFYTIVNHCVDEVW